MRTAFSLIELSIVLVIVGLIVGGVMIGQSMIHQSKLRKAIHEWKAYHTGIHTFRLKYDCLPGDCRKAVALGVDTWDGNGNGQIGYIHPGQYENYRAWYQLSRTGLIPHKIDTISNLANVNNPKAIGIYYPQSTLTERLGWGFGVESWNLRLGQGVGGHSEIGRTDSQNASLNYGVMPEDAQMIDSKMDDGMPNTGIVRDAGTGGGNARICRTNTHSTAANIPYAKNDSGGNCALLFSKSF